MRGCDKTVTLFNARYDAENDCDEYVGTVITGVSWFCEDITTVDASGLKAASKYRVRIPIDADFDGKVYTDPISFATDAEGKFTLKAGDIIVKGIASEVNPRPNELQKKYAECITILSITNSSHAPRAPHWKVVGA